MRPRCRWRNRTAAGCAGTSPTVYQCGQRSGVHRTHTAGHERSGDTRKDIAGSAVANHEGPSFWLDTVPVGPQSAWSDP